MTLKEEQNQECRKQNECQEVFLWTSQFHRSKTETEAEENYASLTIRNQFHVRFPEAFRYFLRNKAAELKELHSFLLAARLLNL